MRRLEIEESNPYLLSTWKPYAEIPQTQGNSYMDQPRHNGLEERISFYQNPVWDFTLIAKRTRINIPFPGDLQLVHEGEETIEGTLRDGESYYTARAYIRDDVGSSIYPPVYRITQR